MSTKVDLLHVRDRLELRLQRADLVLRSLLAVHVGEEDAQADLVADLVGLAVGGLQHRDQYPEQQHRDADGDDRRQAGRGAAPQRPQSFADEEEDSTHGLPL